MEGGMLRSIFKWVGASISRLARPSPAHTSSQLSPSVDLQHEATQAVAAVKPQLEHEKPESLLLRLPAELRLDIYERVISSSEPISADKAGNKPILPPLLSVCRLMREEAMKQYFLHVCRHEVQCKAAMGALHAVKRIRSEAEEVILWEKDKAAFAGYMKAWRMRSATEEILFAIDYPIMDWDAPCFGGEWQRRNRCVMKRPLLKEDEVRAECDDEVKCASIRAAPYCT